MPFPNIDDTYVIENAHEDFSAYCLCSKRATDDNHTSCAPSLLRGSGGLALLWKKSLDHIVTKGPTFASHRCLSVTLNVPEEPIIFLAVYLPTRSGGHGSTDDYKRELDLIDATIDNSHPNVLILGDFNADLGQYGGPLAYTTINERGRILLRYIKRWDFFSTHLSIPSGTATSQSPTYTYHSEAHNSVSTIDHIIAPKFLLNRFLNCRVLLNDPLNLSDHFPVVGELTCGCNLKQLYTTSTANKQTANWRKVNSRFIRESYAPLLENLLKSA